jgi:hypothetical protein
LEDEHWNKYDPTFHDIYIYRHACLKLTGRPASVVVDDDNEGGSSGSY